MDNVLCGFRKFFEENGHWPGQYDMSLCQYLPNVKTLERKFGGIINIRKQLNINEFDLRSGAPRSRSAFQVGKRGYISEESIYEKLVRRFHEPYVHYQSRVTLTDKVIRVDFIVYHKNGKFAVDVFCPSNDYRHFSQNVTMKYIFYKDFPFLIYLCVTNAGIDNEMTNIRRKTQKNKIRENIILVSLDEFIITFNKYTPLSDPYA